jgi:hypothetical protein
VLPPGGLKTPCPLKGTRDSWRNNSMEAWGRQGRTFWGLLCLKSRKSLRCHWANTKEFKLSKNEMIFKTMCKRRIIKWIHQQASTITNMWPIRSHLLLYPQFFPGLFWSKFQTSYD